jgi:hypothetical protein
MVWPLETRSPPMNHLSISIFADANHGSLRLKLNYFFPQHKNAISDDLLLWPLAAVPYTIDDSIGE